MKAPIYVRPLSDAEQKAVEAGLRSSNAFVLRRCQILLASSRGERVPVIAGALSCDEQTVRNAIHAFNQTGLETLKEGTSRPHHTRNAFSAEQVEELIAILHRKPRTEQAGVERDVARGNRARGGMPNGLAEAEVLEEIAGRGFRHGVSVIG